MPDYDRNRRDIEATRQSPRHDGEYQRVEREYVERDTYTDEYYRRRDIYNRIAYVVWTFTGFITAMIGLRFILRLIAANPDNPFVNFVYGISNVFVGAFLGIVNDPTAGNSVFEINSLIAILVYILITWGILRLVWMIIRVTEPTDA